MRDFKKLQAIYFLITVTISSVMYVQTNFASSKRVDDLEKQIELIQNIICSMAIEQKLLKAEFICTGRK